MIQLWTAMITILNAKGVKGNGKIQMTSIKPVCFYQAKHICKINLQNWIDKPFEEHYDPPQNQLQGVLF